MLTQVRYQGYAPSFLEQSELEATINQVRKAAPKNASIFALIESDGREFCCTIDVFLEKRSVYTSDIAGTVDLAIFNAVNAIEKKLAVLN